MRPLWANYEAIMAVMMPHDGYHGGDWCLFVRPVSIMTHDFAHDAAHI